MTTLPVIAVVALAAVAVASTRDNSTGNDRQIVTAGTGSGQLAFEPDVEWNSAVLSADGKTLTVTATRVRHQLRGCYLEVISDVIETDDAVTVGLQDAIGAEVATPTNCTLAARVTVAKVHLEKPLGNRVVYDGLRPKARTIFRLADLAQVTYVPAGFKTNLDDVPFGDSNVQQTYDADGADWYFAVNQEKDSISSPLAGASTPIMVNDVEGVRITGQMNNTMESIRFPLGDRTVTVWGEMQGPPTFTHSDELLKIAEGVTPPSSDITLVTPNDPPSGCLAGFAAPTAELEDQFVGLTVKDAEALAVTLDVPFRLIRTTDVDIAGCAPNEDDLRPTRVNAIAERGKIIAIATG